MNFGVVLGIFTAILEVTWAFLPGCFGQVKVNFRDVLGIFTVIFVVVLGILTAMFRAISGEFWGG